METTSIDDMGAEQVLARAGDLHQRRRSADVEIFLLAAHFADLHSPDSRPVRSPSLPGMEKALRVGGEGTPAMWEFAVAELAVQLECSTHAARYLIRDAVNTRHRLPLVWARVQAGEVKVSYARFVAQQTHHLSAEAAGLVDEQVAEAADGRITWSRFMDLVAGAVVAADPEAAARREAEAAARQFAKTTRSSEHGTRGFYLRAGIGMIARFDATVAYLAAALRALGDPDDEDTRRVKACLLMANPAQAVELLAAFAAHRARGSEEDRPLPRDDEPEPPACPTCGGVGSGDPAPFTRPRPFRPGDATVEAVNASGRRFVFDPSALLPRVSLYLHLAQDTLVRDRGGVVRWEGEGPVTVQYVREQLAPFHRFDIHPVIDLANMAPVDAYEIPRRHSEAVHLRTPADIFPFSSNTSRSKQIDHTEAYLAMARGGQPGQSRLGNYGPMTAFHHRIKTFGPWTVRQPFPGIYVWRSPGDEYYLVDHTGTRKLRGGAGEGGAGGLEIQVYAERDPLDYAVAHAG